MRVIIRFSLNNDVQSALRNLLVNILGSAGFTLSKTGTHECTCITEAQLNTVLCDFWAQAVNPPNNAQIDHVWIYADNP